MFWEFNDGQLQNSVFTKRRELSRPCFFFIRLNLRLQQITQTSVFKVLAIAFKLSSQFQIFFSYLDKSLANIATFIGLLKFKFNSSHTCVKCNQISSVDKQVCFDSVAQTTPSWSERQGRVYVKSCCPVSIRSQRIIYKQTYCA